MTREPIEVTRQDRIYCLKASSNYHSEVCEECKFYPNCDHTTQDDMAELTIKDLEALEQEPSETIQGSTYGGVSWSGTYKSQQLSDDCISRQAVLEYIEGSEAELGHSSENELVCQDIKEFPPVVPQPKTGHWKAKSFHELFCDNCGFDFDIMRNDFTDKMLYCPNCGAKMESEETE